MGKRNDPTTLDPRVRLDDAMIEKLVTLVKAGNYIEVAAAACGISEAAYFKWMRIGRELAVEYETEDNLPEPFDEYGRRCLRLYTAMRVAQAEAEAYAVAIVRKHMPDQWTAAMTFLERRYPGRWKRRDETTVRNPFDPQVQDTREIEQAVLNDPEAVKLLHDALSRVARGELAPGEVVVDAKVVEDD